MKKFKFSIHPLFIVFVAALIYLGYFYVLLAYLITIVLHEFAHAFIANRLGYRLNHITLMPHGAALSGQNAFFSARDEILVAIAGPILNLILAVIGCALWWIWPESYAFTEQFVYANMVTAVLNCLPIFPLDGGRVVLALLSRNGNRTSAVKKIKVTGIIVSVSILVGFVITVFFVPNYTMLVFGSFLFVTALLEDKSAYYSHINLLESKAPFLARGLKIREIAVPETIELYKLFNAVTPDSLTDFNVIDKNYHIIGKITESELERLINLYPANTRLSIILNN